MNYVQVFQQSSVVSKSIFNLFFINHPQGPLNFFWLRRNDNIFVCSSFGNLPDEIWG